MKKLLITSLATMMVAVCTSLAFAASFTFDGNITYHNDIVKIGFTLNEKNSDAKVWTDSYQNGVNFDPVTALWKKTGSDFELIRFNDNNDTIAPGQTEYDSGFSLAALDAGEYLFTIGAYNNVNKGNHLSDGFVYDDDFPVVLTDWKQPANHKNMGSYYRINFAGVPSAGRLDPIGPVPEPATMALFGLGLIGLSTLGSRKRK